MLAAENPASIGSKNGLKKRRDSEMMQGLTKIMCAILILSGANLKSLDVSQNAIGAKDCARVCCLACCLNCLCCLATPLKCAEECSADCDSSGNEDDDEIENGLIQYALGQKME